jgi:hypothetical protein
MKREAPPKSRHAFAIAKNTVARAKNLLIFGMNSHIAPGSAVMSNVETPITIKKYANRRLYNTA